MARNMAGPLLFLNLVLYCIVVGFASWCINRYINGQSARPGVGGNGAMMFFLVFVLSVGVVEIVSKLLGALHVRAWRGDSLAAATTTSVVALAITALAFGLAWKEINVGWYRGWRLEAESVGSFRDHRDDQAVLVRPDTPGRSLQQSIRAGLPRHSLQRRHRALGRRRHDRSSGVGSKS